MRCTPCKVYMWVCGWHLLCYTEGLISIEKIHISTFHPIHVILNINHPYFKCFNQLVEWKTYDAYVKIITTENIKEFLIKRGRPRAKVTGYNYNISTA